jgi:hypothetical protein
MNIRPYIGVESGTQLEPELSRLIGSAMFTDDGIDMLCISCRAAPPLDPPATLRVTMRAGVGRFLSPPATTSAIPHFGQSPGRSIITSRCMAQVYFCAVSWTAPPDAARIMLAAKIKKNSFFILVLKIG